MDFEQYCKDKIDIGVFNLKLSEDEFVKNCKRCYGIGGMSSADIDLWYGFGENDFTFKEKTGWTDNEMVTKFAGSWAELYHFLREKYGKEDKQLTFADVRENTHGEWKLKSYYSTNKTYYECSACGGVVTNFGVFSSWRYCPHCGADMRGETK